MKTNKFHFLIIALFISLVSFGCDSNEDDDALGDILGDWQQVESDPEVDLFLRITRDEVIVAGSSTIIATVACTTLGIDDYDADSGVMDVTEGDGTASTSSVRLTGDMLIVDSDTYNRSSSFPTCTVNLSNVEFEDALDSKNLLELVPETR